MKIGAINYQTRPNWNFTGENNKKNNHLRNTAGAVMIALAATVPAKEAEAQVIYPPITIFPEVKIPRLNEEPAKQSTVRPFVPTWLFGGDKRSSKKDKDIVDLFLEIDGNEYCNSGKIDGKLSIDEVLSIEKSNWGKEHTTYFTPVHELRTARLFYNLAKKFDQDGDPSTITFDEYLSILRTLMKEVKENKRSR